MFQFPFNSDWYFLLAFFLTNLLPILLALFTYIFESLAIYTLAKRRGIHNYGLAWVPIASNWVFGALADQFNELVRGKKTHMRHSLLILSILQAVVSVIVIIAFVIFVIFFASSIGGAYSGSDATSTPLIWSVLALVLIVLIIIALSITIIVLFYIALYRIYSSCDPNNATLYLVLNIIFLITIPILLFVCRKKDWGMVAPQPVYYPTQPSVLPAEPTTDFPEE